MTTVGTIESKRWAYQIIGNVLMLFEFDEVNRLLSAPSLDITDGLMIEGVTGAAVFVNSDGDPDNSAPDEDSILNMRDSELDAVVAYVKHKLYETNEKFNESIFWENKFYVYLHKAMAAMEKQPIISQLYDPYTIR